MTDELKDAIKAEHTRAELQRLEDGLEGCGCSDCQELYRTLDLTKYGSRVIRVDGIVLVKEKRREKADNGSPLTDSQPLQDEKERVTKVKADNFQQGSRGIMLQRRGRPEKPAGEPVSRMTLYRRQRKAAQGVLV